jgi:hypothetical protein
MKTRSVVCVIAILMVAAGGGVAQVRNAIPLLYQPLIPTSVAPGSGPFTLTVNGTGFAATAVVNWNGVPQVTEVISNKRVKALIGAPDVAVAKTAWITVTNPPPGGGTSNVVFFPITRPSSAIGMAISQPFPGASAVVVGDFNNDGNLDVGWLSENGFNVSLGDGKGGFKAPITTQDFPVSSIVAADFNGDGKLDVAGIAPGFGIEVMLGNGDGTFTEGSYIPPTTGWQNFITTADFTGSGYLDLYTVGQDLGQQWFIVGAIKYYVDYTPGPAAIGDFNGDGVLDLAVPEAGLGSFDIWLGSGTGFQELGAIYGGDYPVVAADMNRDGKLDLVAGCILLGAGNGTFKAAGCPPLVGSYGAGTLVGIGDFNGDGKLDAAFNAVPPGVVLALGGGDGTYPRAFVFPFPTYSGLGGIGDFNNDGKLDLVTSDGYLLIQTTVDLTPFSLTFGSQEVGTTSAVQTATLTNVGTSALAINQISITGKNAASFAQSNACGTSLAPGTSCKISVRFKPKAGGSLVAQLTVSYKGTASPQNVALSGKGITPPTAALLPASLKFATQLAGTTAPEQTVTLSNTGDLPVTISKISISGPFGQTNNCPASPGVIGSCQIQVVFKPTAGGTASGTLTVTDNAVNSPQKAALSGTGTAITFSPEGLNFGDQKVGTTSVTVPITLKNVGANAVTIMQVSVTGTNAKDFVQTNNCGNSVAGHRSCTINVKFKPTAKGARSAAVSVTDNGGASPQSAALSGTGT